MGDCLWARVVRGLLEGWGCERGEGGRGGQGEGVGGEGVMGPSLGHYSILTYIIFAAISNKGKGFSARFHFL